MQTRLNDSHVWHMWNACHMCDTCEMRRVTYVRIGEWVMPHIYVRVCAWISYIRVCMWHVYMWMTHSHTRTYVTRLALYMCRDSFRQDRMSHDTYEVRVSGLTYVGVGEWVLPHIYVWAMTRSGKTERVMTHEMRVSLAMSVYVCVSTVSCEMIHWNLTHPHTHTYVYECERVHACTHIYVCIHLRSSLVCGRPTQSIMYVPLQVNRFQKFISLIVQYNI